MLLPWSLDTRKRVRAVHLGVLRQVVPPYQASLLLTTLFTPPNAERRQQEANCRLVHCHKHSKYLSSLLAESSMPRRTCPASTICWALRRWPEPGSASRKAVQLHPVCVLALYPPVILHNYGVLPCISVSLVAYHKTEYLFQLIHRKRSSRRTSPLSDYGRNCFCLQDLELGSNSLKSSVAPIATRSDELGTLKAAA